MPGIFDNFNASQANNGQAQPNPQVASGAPGFQAGSWGNQPNFSNGMQQFLKGRMGMPMAGAQPTQPGQIMPGGPMPGAPAGAGAPPGVQHGMFGAPAQAGQAGGVMLPPGAMPQQPGMPMNASQPAVMPQQGTVTSAPGMGAGGGASSPYGNNTSFAGGMQQFLGARPT